MTLILDNLNIEQNITYSTLAPNSTETASSVGGNLILTNSSNTIQIITGSSTTFSVTLPDATTLISGWKFEIWNECTVPITLRYSGGTVAFPMPAKSAIIATLQSNSSVAGTWLSLRMFTGVASGVLNYNLTSSTTYSMASSSETQITGFAMTPVSGTYAVWFNARGTNTSGSATNGWVIYRDYTRVNDSHRTSRCYVNNADFVISTQTVCALDGATSISVYVSRTGGTLNVYSRSLTLIRLGD